VARNASEVEAFARDHGFPLVLKPIASARGRWVTRVASREEIADAVLAVQRGLQDSEDVARLIGFARVAQLELECDPRRDFLVESYADGDVLEADGVVAATEIVSFGVTEQIPSIDPPFFIEGYALPAARDPLSIADVEAHAARAIRAVGLAHSGYSIEFRVDGRSISLIEINGRLGWDEGFGDLFSAVIGVQPALCAMRVALGRVPALAPTGVHAAIAYRCHYAEGRVAAVPSSRELEELLKRDLQAAVHVEPGRAVHAPPHADLLPHLARVLAVDRASSSAAYARARDAVDRLRFEIVPNTSSNSTAARESA
jgi:biotin carboxylase